MAARAGARAAEGGLKVWSPVAPVRQGGGTASRSDGSEGRPDVPLHFQGAVPRVEHAPRMKLFNEHAGYEVRHVCRSESRGATKAGLRGVRGPPPRAH